MKSKGEQRNPYVGPRPFSSEDRSLFFGRDREIRDLTALAVANRALLVYAPSGAGKTSLLNAGVLPLLRDSGFDVLPSARVRGLAAERTGAGELSNIYIFNVINNWINEEQADPRRRLPQVLPRGPGIGSKRPVPEAAVLSSHRWNWRELRDLPLVEYLNARQRVIDEDGFALPRVLVFDQLEELFSVYPEQWPHRSGFFDQVRVALKQDQLLRVLLAIREDYLAHLDPFSHTMPDRLRARFRVEPLNEKSALAAVTQPLRSTRRFFGDGVAESLVEDLLTFRVDTGMGDSVEVRGESVEPVQLQVVCQSLWASLDPEITEITARELFSFGDVDEVLGRFYERSVQEATRTGDVDEARLRSWLEESFITSLGTRATIYSSPGATAGMPNVVIENLENQHIIRGEWRAGARWLELAHDRFIDPIRTSNRRFLMAPEVREKQDATQRANRALALAEEARVAGRSNEALEFAQEAAISFTRLDDSAGIAAALTSQAYVSHQLGKDEQAKDLFERALATYERTGETLAAAETLNNLGNLYFDLNRLEDAMQAYQQAARLEPKVAYAWYNLGVVSAAVGHYGEAVERYRQAIELEATTAESWQGLGTAYAGQEKYEEAISAYRKAIELDPRVITAWSSLGDAYKSQRKHDDAIDAYRNGIDVDPHAVAVWVSLGNSYVSRGRNEEAIDAYRKAIELDRESASAWNGLGNAYQERNEYDEAIRAYSKAIDLDPDTPIYWNNLGLVHSERDRDTAIAAYQKAIQLDSSGWQTYANVANTLLRYGDLKEASRYYSMSIDRAPGINVESYVRLGVIDWCQDRTSAAEDLLRKALATWQDAWNGLVHTDADLLELKALAFLLLGERREALANIVRAVKELRSEKPLESIRLGIYRLLAGARHQPAGMDEYRAILGLDVVGRLPGESDVKRETGAL